ncbi:MAG: nucleoside triphosphate pyrophosphatase [Syntrophobacteraceae bacterium]
MKTLRWRLAWTFPDPENGPEQPMVYEVVSPLILASASPRRAALLQSIGLVFQVVPSGTDESEIPDEPPERMAELWASEKARVVSEQHPAMWVLAADTIVVADAVPFGKPKSLEDAISILRILSGRAHEVITGMALACHGAGILELQSVRTEVLFKELSDREIDSYVRTGKPMDKAGAYGIQGIGAFLVRSIRGSYTNVVGLPLAETADWLQHHGVIRPRRSESTAMAGEVP